MLLYKNRSKGVDKRVHMKMKLNYVNNWLFIMMCDKR